MLCTLFSAYEINVTVKGEEKWERQTENEEEIIRLEKRKASERRVITHPELLVINIV